MHQTAQSENNSLVAITSQLAKKYGKGIVMKLGDRKKENVPVISTGSWGLDSALGIGGVQKSGGNALLIDTEHAFDKRYAKSLGIDVENLLICQPDYGEQALDVAEQCIRSEAVKLVVIDSVSALIPSDELKGNIGDRNVGGQARLMSQAMRKLVAIVHKTSSVCLFINQLRHKIGVIYGSPETTSGGNALKFYASVRLDIRNVGAIKNKDNEKIGQRSRVKVVKNKMAAPFKEATFDIFYGKGISHLGEIIDGCLSLGIIKKAGAWFSYEKEQLGQGREAVIKRLQEDAPLQKAITERIKKALQG